MLPQIQPNEWSCLPTAFAIALGMKVEDFIKQVGHDGSKIEYPQYSEPHCRRSFHIQEMYDVCLKLNVGVTPIELETRGFIGSSDVLQVVKVDIGGQERMDKYLDRNPGVVTGLSLSGSPHAVAWDRKKVIDPNGRVYNLSNFKVELFYIFKI